MTRGDYDPPPVGDLERTEPVALADAFSAPDELAVFVELETLKFRMDVDEKRFKELKLEAGALVAVAGGTSGAYGSIVVTLRAGGATKKFSEQLLLTTKIVCPHCGEEHFYPSRLVDSLFERGTKKDSVEVSIAGARGKKRE